MRRRKPRVVRTTLVRLGLATAAVAIAVPPLFELAYRLQVVDTYAAELRAYNSPELLESGDGRPTLLAMGDSLTAGDRSYPARLRGRLPDWRVINAGIPATNALQANLVARKRFARFAPDVLVYQVNVSNDLMNLRFPVNWSELSPARNLYWTLSRRLRGLEYLNYRAAQFAFARRARRQGSGGAPLAPIDPVADCVQDGAAFEPAGYTARERLYLRAEPYLIENQVRLRGGREADFESWMTSVVRLLERCAIPNCERKLLVVPHAAQVAHSYLDEMRSLGARFDDADAVMRGDYGFLAAVRESLGRHGLDNVEVLDPLPQLREAERAGIRTYYRYDPHLTSCGQQVLTDVVANSLPSSWPTVAHDD